METNTFDPEAPRRNLAEARAELKEAVRLLRQVIEAEEDAIDVAIANQRLKEIADDPSLIVSGAELTRRLDALR